MLRSVPDEDSSMFALARTHLRNLLACCTASFLVAGHGSAQTSWFVPVEGDVYDLVWDPHRSVLYFGRESGAVGVYDPAAKQMLPEFPSVGVQIRGMDITPEGHKLFVADRWRPSSSSSSRYLRVIDLETREVRSIAFAAAFSIEQGSWDVAIGNGGWAFLTTEISGSGNTPARRVNVEGEWVEYLPAASGGGLLTDGQSRVTGSPDRSFVHVIAPSYGKFMFNYDVSVPESLLARDLGVAGQQDPSFSRDGSLIASWVSSSLGSGLNILDADTLLPVAFLGDQRGGGFVFDPVRDQFYAGDDWNIEVVAYSTVNWTEQWRVAVPGVNPTFWISGEYAVSSDGQFLFVSRQETWGLGLPSGFFVIDLDSFECGPDLTSTAIAGQTGYGSPNGVVNNDDFFYFLAQFAVGNIAVADLTAGAVAGQPGYGVPNGVLNNDDFFYYLGLFAAGC
jgi:hypothetical protein